jgi:hypothetical protein
MTVSVFRRKRGVFPARLACTLLLGLTLSACPQQPRSGHSRGSEAEAARGDPGSAASSSRPDEDISQADRDFRGSMGAPPVAPGEQ